MAMVTRPEGLGDLLITLLPIPGARLGDLVCDRRTETTTDAVPR